MEHNHESDSVVFVNTSPTLKKLFDQKSFNYSKTESRNDCRQPAGNQSMADLREKMKQCFTTHGKKLQKK